jgi:hypothetical protein
LAVEHRGEEAGSVRLVRASGSGLRASAGLRAPDYGLRLRASGLPGTS